MSNYILLIVFLNLLISVLYPITIIFNSPIQMNTLGPLIKAVRVIIDPAILHTMAVFNDFTAQLDFTAFCIIYSIILLLVLKKCNQGAIFRPKNKELISWRVRVKQSISAFFFSLPIIKQYVDRKFEKNLDEVGQIIYKDFEKDRDQTKSKKLPQQGMRPDKIESRVTRWFESEEKKMFTGKLSGAIYVENAEHCKEVNNFAAKYMYHNPLHLDTYKQVSKMEAQILKMTNSLISKERAYGVITSGGSQSLIMSLYAYKNYYPHKTKPNIVVPNTIHAALDKGCMYFNIEIRKAKLNDKFQADISHMKSLIDSNTICLYGSYPNYPHGIIDPIEQIAKLAKDYGIGCHVDGCLGGFVAGFLKQHQNKFTIDINGVTSISLDHHKFALAPKGISTVFFKIPELRHSMYYVETDWVGAVYATPSFCGSRSGFASAGAWYSLTHVGRKQFVENALLIQDATKTAVRDLKKIEGINIVGNPELCVFAFWSDIVDPFSISSELDKTKGWKISPTHLPKCLHVSVTLGNCENIKKNFARDVRQVVQNLKKQPQKQNSVAAVYGATATIPTASMGQDLIRKIVSVTYK